MSPMRRWLHFLADSSFLWDGWSGIEYVICLTPLVLFDQAPLKDALSWAVAILLSPNPFIKNLKNQ